MAGESGQGHLSDDTAMDLGFLDELIGSGSGLLDDVNGFTDEVMLSTASHFAWPFASDRTGVHMHDMKVMHSRLGDP
jgi:hypothetical protein